MTFRRLLGFLRPYRGQVIVSTLLAVGAQAAGLTVPYLTGQVKESPRTSYFYVSDDGGPAAVAIGNKSAGFNSSG